MAPFSRIGKAVWEGVGVTGKNYWYCSQHIIHNSKMWNQPKCPLADEWINKA